MSGYGTLRLTGQFFQAGHRLHVRRSSGSPHRAQASYAGCRQAQSRDRTARHPVLPDGVEITRIERQGSHPERPARVQRHNRLRTGQIDLRCGVLRAQFGEQRREQQRIAEQQMVRKQDARADDGSRRKGLKTSRGMARAKIRRRPESRLIGSSARWSRPRSGCAPVPSLRSRSPCRISSGILVDDFRPSAARGRARQR